MELFGNRNGGWLHFPQIRLGSGKRRSGWAWPLEAVFPSGPVGRLCTGPRLTLM